MNESTSVDFAWGREGAERLAPGIDAFVVVDVLCFCTTVEVAVARGAIIHPAADAAVAEALARSFGIERAQRRGSGHYSLSPVSFREVPTGTSVVLPSPNGSAVCAAIGAGSAPFRGQACFAGCLRNASAVAEAAAAAGARIGVIAAGERRPDGTLRKALEDEVGAGAIIARIAATRTPAAAMAVEAFTTVRGDLARHIRHCPSGQELVAGGYAADVDWAAVLDISRTVPQLIAGAFRARPR